MNRELFKSEKQEYNYLTLIDMSLVKEMLGESESESYKGSFGTLFCLCGSKKMPGSAMLSILSALRSGVGMVKAGVSESIYPIISKKILEAVYTILPENEEGTVSNLAVQKILENVKKCTAVLVGCGLGIHENVDYTVKRIVEELELPILIDADGINAVAKYINILKSAKGKIIITPHIGEASRLLKVPKSNILANKFKYAKHLSEEYKVITVLKGSETVICDESGNLYLNKAVNSGMAKAGNGDVLSGVIASLLAQGFEPIKSAVCGVYIHSLAGEICRKEYSETAMLPTDLIEKFPEIFIKMNR